MNIIADTEHLATVTTLHPNPVPGHGPRELPHVKHEVRPTHPHDLLEYRIEQQLVSLWDQGLDPELFIATFAPALADRIRPLLDALYDASAEAWDARYGTTAERTVAELAYEDALFELARVVRDGA